MKTLFFAATAALMASQAFAQKNDLATATGQEVSALIGSYRYTEPGAQPISIHGIKFGGEYTGTVSLDRRRHWFAQFNVRGAIGSTTYDGFCAPWLISPNSGSPNGYELDLGDFSACSESGDKDWYVETRGVFGKDFIGHALALSPYAGVGLRHLSNGTTGTSGYRTDNYLSVPVGVTARARLTSHHVLSFNLEYDHMMHGWQTTRSSQLGSGTIPATDTAPEFSIDGFTDVSFSQPGGWALRASAKYQLNRQWFVEPYYVYWSVKSSADSPQTVFFTVNGISAQEQFGSFEPFNTTHELGVKLGFRF